MNANDLETAVTLLNHYRRRQGELAQLRTVSYPLHAVTLHFGGAGEKISISLRDEISDAESLRIEILDQLTRLVGESKHATRQFLADLGVEI